MTGCHLVISVSDTAERLACSRFWVFELLLLLLLFWLLLMMALAARALESVAAMRGHESERGSDNLNQTICLG